MIHACSLISILYLNVFQLLPFNWLLHGILETMADIFVTHFTSWWDIIADYSSQVSVGLHFKHLVRFFIFMKNDTPFIFSFILKLGGWCKQLVKFAFPMFYFYFPNKQFVMTMFRIGICVELNCKMTMRCPWQWHYFIPFH